MSFDFLNASLPIRKEPHIQWRKDWETFYGKQFRDAYNWYDILEETEFGSEKYQPLKVRTTYVLNPGTGIKLSDDWKACIFDVGYVPKMGRRYQYFNQTWITVNTEGYGSPTNNCVIRRCNSFLTMQDKFGNIHREPCAIDPGLKYGNIYYNNSVNIAQSAVQVWLQLNEYTKNIAINDRYILGYSQVFKVKTVMNYLSDYTFDPDGSPLITIDLSLDTDQVGDDFADNTTGSSNIIPDIHPNRNFIGITPSDTNIYEGTTVTYTCESYVGSVPSGNPFTFNVILNDIPDTRYLFEVINDNSFRITNYKKYTKEKLKIDCIDNITGDNKVIEFMLGGSI